jgi:hypothetical protein
MSTLEQLNFRWQEYFASPGAVPLLGLAPMSNEEAAEAKRAVHEFVRSRADCLPRCLAVYPAVTSTLLAVSAANGYHGGTFWPRLAAELGFPGELTSQAQRQALTTAFRNACRELGLPRWLPQHPGGFILVEEFLFHAGFPVCHSHHLAGAMRALERNSELPDPADPNADDTLSERLSERLGNLPIPTMLRALRGSAGPLVARAALEVLSTGGYDQLNPHLGEALKKAFEARTVSMSGPRLRPPFLRLDENLTGFEVLCPAQDESFVLLGRFGWQVNGRFSAWPSGDDFVVSTGNEESIEVAATGLRQFSSLARSWDLSEFRQPLGTVHVFEVESRRFRKSFLLADKAAELAAGDYWLLFPSGWHCDEANLDHSWAKAVALHVTVQPGKKTQVEGPDGERFLVASRMAPILVPETPAFALTYEGEKLLLGDSLRLHVWLPQGSSDWSVRLTGGGDERTFACELEDAAGDWAIAAVDASTFTKELAPALHEFEAVLLKNGQTKARRRFLLWTACHEFHKVGSFAWTSRPRNLDASACSGFEEMAEGLQVRPGAIPFRSLAFNLGGVVRQFRWRNEGLFAELVHLQSGCAAKVQSLMLGNTIAASADSNAWLRVWFDWEPAPVFLVNGVRENRQPDARGFVEFSLADLAVRHPQGGQIDAEEGGAMTLLVRFASTLRPTSLHKSSTRGFRSLDYILSQRVESVRPCCVELVSGRRFEFKPKIFNPKEPLRFDHTAGGLPAIFVRPGGKQDAQRPCAISLGEMIEIALKEKSSDKAASSEMRVGLDVPTGGWPSGFWLVSLEAARRNTDCCERLAGPDGKPAALLIAIPPADDDSEELLRLLHHVWHETMQNRDRAWLKWAWTSAALASAASLIETARGMFPDGFTELLRNEFAWLDLLEKAVAAEAERLLKAGDDSAPRLLLDLARSRAGRRRLLRVPEVMAFPAHVYIALRHREPAFVALRQCADVCALDWLSQFVAECPETLAGEYLRCFANFPEIATNGPSTEFEGFEITRYWRTLTTIATVGAFDPADDRDLLGPDHWQWALHKFRQRCAEHQSSESLGFANACAHNASGLLAFAKKNVEHTRLLANATWFSPCPSLYTNSDFEETLPRFSSTFALAARAAAERRLNFSEALAALRGHLPEQSFNAGLCALLEIAPELFGFFLLFWQTLIKTSPHYD